MAKMGPAAAPGAAMASPRPMMNPMMNPGSPRPMPNPRLNPAEGQAAPAGGKGMFGNIPIQKRFDMAMELLRSGTAMASESGNPMLSFLAPLAGAAIGGGIENKRAKMMGAEGDELMASMMPGVNQDQLQQLSDIVANPDAPAHLKAIAKARLDAAIKPYMPGYAAPGTGGTARKGGGSPRKSGGKGGGTGKSGEKLYGEYEIDGILHGRNAYGVMIPYKDGAGKPVSGKKPAAAAPAAAAATGPVVIDGYTIEEIK